jgi:hypothetical protein
VEQHVGADALAPELPPRIQRGLQLGPLSDAQDRLAGDHDGLAIVAAHDLAAPGTPPSQPWIAQQPPDDLG